MTEDEMAGRYRRLDGQGHRLVCPSSGTKCFLKAERDEAALVGRGQGGGLFSTCP